MLTRKYLKSMRCLTSLPRKKLKALSNEEILELYEKNHVRSDSDRITLQLDVDGNNSEYVVAAEYAVGNHKYCRLVTEDGNTSIFAERRENAPAVIVDQSTIAIDLRVEALSIKNSRSFDTCFIIGLCAALLIAGGFYIGSLKDDQKDKKKDAKIELVDKRGHAYKSAADMYEKVSSAIVRIESYNLASVCSCASAGMIISPDGYVISCEHIFDGLEAPKFRVVMQDGTAYDATFVASDSEADICILKITNNVDDLPYVTFGNSKNTVPGEECVIMGFPGYSKTEPIVTTGVISATSVEINGLGGYVNDFLQTTAPANPGASGGALFNMSGQVIGIINSKDANTYYENTVYCLPSTTVQFVVNQLLDKGIVERISIGITYMMTDNNEHNAGIPYGCRIDTVSEGSAVKDLIKPGQVIVACNGVSITRLNTLQTILPSSATDRNVTLTMWDPDTNETFDVSFVANIRTGTSKYNPNITFSPAPEEIVAESTAPDQ